MYNKISVIMTCFNRREKTLDCLANLLKAKNYYNDNNSNKIIISVFLTDDGCTDGTSDAIKKTFPQLKIHILQGNGSLYWNGGMRLAWNEALKKHNETDFYLLLNDDTSVFSNVFGELLKTHEFSLKEYGKSGIYSGATCDIQNRNKTTYGGSLWINKFLGTDKLVSPNGVPQKIDKANANILLVPKSVVNGIGIFYEGYLHGAADYDYSIHAIKKGIPVLLTSNYSGICERDHSTFEERRDKILSMSLKERIIFFKSPLHSNRDKLIYTKRNIPFRYPFVFIGRILNVYCPRIYYILSGIRGAGNN